MGFSGYGGDPADDEDDTPGPGGDQLNLKMSGFWMGETEVTQAQWLAVMGGENPSYFKGDTLPVEQVRWIDIMGEQTSGTPVPKAGSFMARLNTKTGRSFALPTEAQWEYACHAGQSERFGERFSLGSESEVALFGNYGWFVDNSSMQTHPVAKKTSNDWGLRDMHGNVSEWCADWYQDSYQGLGATDPTGPASGSDRVYRGGGWNNFAQNCRSANRLFNRPTFRSNYIGFRVALQDDRVAEATNSGGRVFGEPYF